MSTIDDLSEEAKIQALEAGQVVKDMTVVEGLEGVVSAKSLDGQTETLGDMEPGSPKTIGYEADYGETLKPEVAQWPETQPVADAPSAPEPEPLADAVSQDSKVSEFDKWLEAAQGQEPKESHEHDKGNDLDR